jgi:hypothetical protein
MKTVLLTGLLAATMMAGAVSTTPSYAEEPCGPGQHMQNGICWQRVYIDPLPDNIHNYTCRATKGTVEIRIGNSLVDVTHVTNGKRLQYPRMEWTQGEDEVKWEGQRNDGLTVRSSFPGEGLNLYIERLYRSEKLISKTVFRCKYKGGGG